MEMRELGATGIRASVIGLGCNNFGIYQNPFATMEANYSILVRDAEKTIIQ
jgi:aryl-alcohol dehydrogenase-like predicted oxidoreductase